MKFARASKNLQMKNRTVKNNVADFLNKYSIKDKRVLIAFSGGNDSMCLMAILLELKEKFGLDIIAIHLNHNWRGEESFNEEKRCREFCEAKGIDFYSETLSDNVKRTETAARDARYEFFNRCAEKFNTNIVFTAHNADDNSETVLYRLVKGTGIKGLCGIAEHRDIFYRPLLTTFRKDIEEYISENGLTPNQDSSNNNNKYNRNFIRLKIIPQLETINKDFKDALNCLSELACDDEKIIGEYIKSLKNPYKTDNFMSYSTALQKRLVYNLLTQNDFEYDNKTISKLQKFILENACLKNGKRISLTDKTFLFVSSKEIRILKEGLNDEICVEIDGEGVFDVGNYILKVEKCTSKPEKFPPDSENILYADLSGVDFQLVLRTRQDGDIISPLGCNGTQKLKKYLNEKGLPKDLRNKMLFLCLGNEVLWAPSLGISEKIKVVDKSTHILRLERKKWMKKRLKF